MPDTDRPHTPPRRQKKRHSTPPAFVVFCILLLLIAVGAGLFFFSGPKKDIDTASNRETQAVQQEPAAAEGGKNINTDTAPSVDVDRFPPTPDGAGQEQLAEPGIPGPAVPDGSVNVDRECELLADKLSSFFNHVDAEEYMKPFALPLTAQTYFIDLAYRLLDNPPVVSRESDDLYTILKNMAHFFRVIGGNNILLMKAILDRERDKIEDVASELYQWTTIGTCTSDRFDFTAPLEKIYEYAGFFLNTMGGRSYLFRRDSRSRLLVNYYSILIVATANERGLNRHGINISLLIPQLIQEIESTTQLIYKENYLDQLYSLMEKYQ
jgi:hypothetical protein